ncbi:hypothetical protein V6N13_006192 [Hibiscus sabdariffa]
MVRFLLHMHRNNSVFSQVGGPMMTLIVWLKTIGNHYPHLVTLFLASLRLLRFGIRLFMGTLVLKKCSIMAPLRGAQKALEQRHSGFFVQLEHDLQIELEALFDQEKLLWRQKSCSNYVASGDRNTVYFHRKVELS